MMLKTPRGTKDYLPEEMKKRTIVVDKFRKVFEKYGYREVCTPAFEHLEVLEKKGGLGEENVKDIYRFQDKAGRWLGLRFDMTTPTTRIIVNNPKLLKPVKWYYISNMWRYESPQRGRLREFWQAGIENIGTKDKIVDAEILAVTYDALIEAGIKDFIFKINSREIMDKISDYYKVKDYSEFYKVLDKKGKLSEIAWREKLKKFFKDKREYKDFLKLIEIPWTEAIEKISTFANKEIEYLKGIIDYCKKFGIKNEYLINDFLIVRGLDYYTGFVFEAYKKDEENLGSLAAGGRYDNLIELYGGPKTPATGMAIGIERVMETISDSISPDSSPDILILPLEDSFKRDAVKLATILRNNDIACDIEIMRDKLKKKLSYANSLGIKYSILIGEDEIKKNIYSLRNMKKNRQYTFSLEKLIDYLKKDKKNV